MQQNLQNKAGLVEGVFNKVYDKYDLMNDFMSFGIHRIWKKNLMNWMNPTKNKKYPSFEKFAKEHKQLKANSWPLYSFFVSSQRIN